MKTLITDGFYEEDPHNVFAKDLRYILANASNTFNAQLNSIINYEFEWIVSPLVNGDDN